jgi:hypothetical protein
MSMLLAGSGWASTDGPPEPWFALNRFSELFSVRPEFRYEYAYSAKPWDNGLKNSQTMFAIDAIIRY